MAYELELDEMIEEKGDNFAKVIKNLEYIS